jgi:hypothetical protein
MLFFDFGRVHKGKFYVYLVINPNIARFLSMCSELIIGLSPHKYQTLSMCFVIIALGL